MQKILKDTILNSAGAYDEVKAHDRYKARCIAGAVGAGIILLFITYPAYILFVDAWLTDETLSERLFHVQQYFATFGRVLAGEIHLFAWLKAYYGDWVLQTLRTQHIPSLAFLLAVIVIPTATFFAVSSRNPHIRNPNIHGSARYATASDIEKMSEKDRIGFDGDGAVVGRAKDAKGKSRLLRMKETLTVLLLAPAGTGKSVKFVIPTIAKLDHHCMMVFDFKPELTEITSGHRSSLGPTYQIAWSRVDQPDGVWLTPDEQKSYNPEYLQRDSNGELVKNPFSGEVKTRPLYFPSWNPLSPTSLPRNTADREVYIDRLANVLIPDPKSGGDRFFTSRARQAMIGLTLFMIYLLEAAEEFQGEVSLDLVPAHMIGSEPSFPMLVDLLAKMMGDVDDGAEDPIRVVIRRMLDTCSLIDSKYREARNITPMARPIVELSQLLSQATQTRSSILTSLDDGLAPFKNEAVRQRTIRSDFSLADLRGKPKPEAVAREMQKVAAAKAEGFEYKPRYARDEFDPVTIYVTVNQADIKAFAAITGILIDAMNAKLVSYGPNTIDDQGNQMGPYDFTFMLDEAPQLPRLETIRSGPATGRSKRISYNINGQDFGQFAQVYSREDVEVMKTNGAVFVVLSQNNEKTAKAISERVGKTTILSQSQSDRDRKPMLGFGGVLDDIDKSKRASNSLSWQSVDFLNPGTVMAMPDGKHIVLVQDFMNRPILADSTPYFADPDLVDRCFNPRTFTGPYPALPMSIEEMDRVAAVRNGSTAAAPVERKEWFDISEPTTVGFVLLPNDVRAINTFRSTAALPADAEIEMMVVRADFRHPFSLPPAAPSPLVSTSSSNPDEIIEALRGCDRVMVYDRTEFRELVLEKASQDTVQPHALYSFQDLLRRIGAPVYPLNSAASYLTESQPMLVPIACTPSDAWVIYAELYNCVIGQLQALFEADSFDAPAPSATGEQSSNGTPSDSGRSAA